MIEGASLILIQLNLQVALRRHTDTRVPWTLMSIPIRIAHAMELSTDGAELGLSPFET